MKWTIQKISPKEESVYLVNSDCGVLRKISVPGTQDAWINGDRVIIKSKTGYFWEIDPDTGWRKRMFGQQPLL